jgi:hypothetical protein
MTLCLLNAFAAKKENARKKRNTLYKILLLMRIKLMLQERNYVTRDCLASPCDASWAKIYAQGNDKKFVSLVSLTRRSFKQLLVAFTPHYEATITWRPGGPGCPQKFVHTHQVLGMLLAFYTKSRGMKSLCVKFGIPPATASRTLDNAERCLLATLKATPLAAFNWPTLEEQVKWAKLVEKKEPLVKGRWGVIERKTYKVQKPTAVEVQNATNNGWLHATMITGAVCFGATGVVVWGKHNFVGSWNNGDISRPFQEKIVRSDINVDGHGVLSDSTFAVSGDCLRRIMTPLKKNEELTILDPVAVKTSAAIASMRQHAEWGMGAVEKMYRRLLLPLPFDQEVRGRRLAIIFKLYNYRVRTTGFSIKNIFESE